MKNDHKHRDFRIHKWPLRLPSGFVTWIYSGKAETMNLNKSLISNPSHLENLDGATSILTIQKGHVQRSLDRPGCKRYSFPQKHMLLSLMFQRPPLYVLALLFYRAAPATRCHRGGAKTSCWLSPISYSLWENRIPASVAVRTFSAQWSDKSLGIVRPEPRLKLHVLHAILNNAVCKWTVIEHIISHHRTPTF
jgi:hypothetical protein